jgi:hypothetical protein
VITAGRSAIPRFAQEEKEQSGPKAQIMTGAEDQTRIGPARTNSCRIRFQMKTPDATMSSRMLPTMSPWPSFSIARNGAFSQ